MGYSNVAGDLNVYGTSTLSALVVSGSTYHYGPITSTSNAAFSNLTANTLTVTGNFIITATNTQASNSLSIVNQGSATALYVNQNESVAHIHNVAEFYDHTTIAMIIDPNGNVAIHASSSPGYAFTTVGGASIDQLTLGTPLSISSGGTGTATGATQNYVFAGPSIGSAGAPSFRAIVNADLPSSISVSNISANGAALSSLSGSNVSGNVANATVALVVSQGAQPNITSVGTLTGLNVQGLLVASNGSGISNVNGANVSTVPTAHSVTDAAQTNITSVGTLSGLNVQGLLIVSNGSGISNINSSNLVGNVANANVALVVSQAAQPNITSVGTLTGLNVQGLLVASNGSGISNINGSNVSTVPTAQSVTVASQGNITSVGTLTGLNVQGLLIVSNGSGISNINGSNVSTVSTAQSVTVASQGNITSVGTLTGLNVQGLLVASNGSGISNINGSNVSTVPTAQSVTVAAQPNITSVGILSNLVVGNSLTTTNVYLSGSMNLQGTANISNIITQNVTAIGTSLVVTSVTVNGNVYVSNTSTAANGFLATGTFGGVFPDGIVMDYVQGTVGNGRLSVGVNDAITFYTGGLGTTSIAYFDPNLRVGLGTVTPGSNLHVVGNVYASNALTTTNAYLTGTLNVQGTSNISVANIANIYTTNIVGFVGSQWTGSSGSTIYYLPQVGVGTSTAGANLTVSGNVYASNALTTANAYLTGTLNVQGTSNLSVANIANIYTTNIVGFVGSQWTGSSGSTIYYLPQVGVGTSTAGANLTVSGNVYASNALTTANAYLTGTLNVQGTSNLSVANIANIYTTNIVGFVGSQWSGSSGSTIYYLPQVGIGTSVTTANLTVSGNLYVSSSIQTGNLILGGVSSGGFLQAQGTSNVTSVSTIPIGSGGTNQTSYGTTGGVVYYDGTRFQAATGITASTATTLNVTTANITTLQTTSFVPAASGLFMNLNATYTLTSTSNWLGNIAGTITSNLYTLFAPLPGVTGWNAYGTSAFVNPPTANGGIRFNQSGPYMFTVVISADNDIKTIALSSNTADVHSNVTNVWSYCYRFGVGTNPSIPVTIPVYVTSTSTYYYIDYETTNQTDNIHQTAYVNVSSQAYTGSYVIIKPI
jgi:hypothetical protein